MRRRTPSRAVGSPSAPPTRLPRCPTSAPDVVLVGGQVRSVAVDLVRAAELVAADAEPPHERPTEELLATT